MHIWSRMPSACVGWAWGDWAYMVVQGIWVFVLCFPQIYTAFVTNRMLNMFLLNFQILNSDAKRTLSLSPLLFFSFLVVFFFFLVTSLYIIWFMLRLANMLAEVLLWNMDLMWYYVGVCGHRKNSALYRWRMSRSLCGLDKHGNVFPFYLNAVLILQLIIARMSI